MKIFKFEAEGDTVYVEGNDFQVASDRFESFMGILPENILTVTEVSELPEGEEFL
jgi:hypothetical protein